MAKKADKKFFVEAWFAEKNMLHVSRKQRVQGFVELHGYIKKESEKAILIEAYYPFKRIERKGGPSEFDWQIEGWLPKKVVEIKNLT